MKRSRAVALVPIFFITLFAFTNCGEGFESVKDSISQASAACLNKLRNEPTLKVSAAGCEVFSDYVCERRIFSPTVDNNKSVRSECGLTEAAGEVCVSVLVNSFNTSGAREPSNAKDFEAGGDYNREEILCANSKLTVNGVSVIHSEGSNVFEALSLAIEKCRARGVK